MASEVSNLVHAFQRKQARALMEKATVTIGLQILADDTKTVQERNDDVVYALHLAWKKIQAFRD